MDVFLGYAAAIAIFCLFLWLRYRNELTSLINRSRASRLRDYVTYDEDKKVLCVYACHPRIEKLLKTRSHGIEFIGRQPDTYTYRSMQIGNVSTGHVSKTPGFDYIAGSTDSGRYELLFAGKPIHAIVLKNPDLAEYARTKDIAQYINEHGVIWVYSPSEVSRSSLMTASYTLYQTAMSAAYPTRAKCNSIINFICYEGCSFSNQ